MIRFNQDVCANRREATEREWLETNGLGGFASSTICGMNTRRYHGLLVAALNPPAGRAMLLSKIEETLVIDGNRFELATNRYPGADHPAGYLNLVEFRQDPFPAFVFQAGGVEVEKTVFMVHGENTTVVQYQLRGLDHDPLPECHLELRPLIAFRDYHGTTRSNGALNATVSEEADGVLKMEPYSGMPAIYFGHDATWFERTGNWYFNFEYDLERERGLDFQEDLFNPFVLRFRLNGHTKTTIIASTNRRPAADADELRVSEQQRRVALLAPIAGEGELVRALAAAADQFIVRRGDLHTIIAGYHWFTDWGRDTMIAFNGLTLATGRFDIARNVLLAFARATSEGMLPNRFPDAGAEPEYNTVDATLWYFDAVRAFGEYTQDFELIRGRIFPALKEIMDWHMRGTRYSIHVDVDGLLYAGEPGVQLTWMDAKVGDWVVTPRTGKPVEIQALWYNALRVMEEFARRFGELDYAEFLGSAANRAAVAFNHQFWNENAGCLFDAVNGEDRDASIRPNQILAVSLRYSMLDPHRAARVVEVVRRDLLTPFGLRSLASSDSRYCPVYTGGVASRDGAYHQGTVWPWLIGPFISAYMRVNERSAQARQEAGKWLNGFVGHLHEAGVGQVSEILDAEPPFTPRGCMAQAWSVAELLRVAVEEMREPAASDGSQASPLRARQTQAAIANA